MLKTPAATSELIQKKRQLLLVADAPDMDFKFNELLRFVAGSK